MRTKFIAAAAAAALVTTLTGAQVAHTAPAPADPAPGRHCYLTLDPIRAGETTSRVTSFECLATGQQRKRATDVLLMTWYEGAKYGGDSITVEGSAPCDESGYGVLDVEFPWDWKISSYKVFNACNASVIYTEQHYKGTPKHFNGDVEYVGDTHNDDVESYRIWKQ